LFVGRHAARGACGLACAVSVLVQSGEGASMRIVYTNLKENDAGVKRSVRQLQVDLGRGTAPAAQRTQAQEAAATARCMDNIRRTVVQASIAKVSSIEKPVALEGIAAVRAAFIRRFTDVEGYGASDSAGFVITV